MTLLASRPRRLAAGAVAATVLFSGGVAASSTLRPKPTEVVYNIPPTNQGGIAPDPFLANGVGIGRNVDVYHSAGIGPAALNTAAPNGTPERYIDYALLAQMYPGFAPTQAERAAGVLPAGLTVTEAQGLNNMARIKENLESVGLSLDRLAYMRIYLDNPPGTERADYNGWNRAYRRFVANVNRATGEVIPSYEPIVFANATRPARANIEVGTLPVAGWLIEIEVIATYG